MLDPIARPVPIGFVDVEIERRSGGPPPLPSPSHSKLGRLLPALPGTVTDATDSAEDTRTQASLSTWLVSPPTMGLGITSHDGRSKQHLHTAAFSDAAANADRPSSALLFAAHETLETFFRLKDHDFRGGAHSPEVLSFSAAAPTGNDNVATSTPPTHASASAATHSAALRPDEPVVSSFPQIHNASNVAQRDASVASQPSPALPRRVAGSTLRAENPQPPSTHTAAAPVNEQLGPSPHWQYGPPPSYPPLHAPMPSFPFAHPSYFPSMPQFSGAYPHAPMLHWPAVPAGHHPATSSQPAPHAAPEMSSIFALLASHPHLWYDADFQRTLATIAGAASGGGQVSADTRDTSPRRRSSESSDASQGSSHVGPQTLHHPPNLHASPILATVSAVAASSAKSPSLPFVRRSFSKATAAEVCTRVRFYYHVAPCFAHVSLVEYVYSLVLPEDRHVSSGCFQPIFEVSEEPARYRYLSAFFVQIEFYLSLFSSVRACFIFHSRRSLPERMSPSVVTRAVVIVQRFVRERAKRARRIEFLTYVRTRRLVPQISQDLLHDFILTVRISVRLYNIFHPHSKQSALHSTSNHYPF